MAGGFEGFSKIKLKSWENNAFFALSDIEYDAEFQARPWIILVFEGNKKSLDTQAFSNRLWLNQINLTGFEQ